MERQIHGLNFENEMIQKYKLTKSNSYTSQYDAYSKSNIPVQIKLVDNNNSRVDFGSLFTNSNVTQDFYLIIGFWEEKPTNVVDIKLMYIKKEDWNDLFDLETVQYIKDTYKDYRCFSKEEQEDSKDKWKKYINEVNKKWSPEVNLMGPRFKRDSKGHIRIQCGMSLPNCQQLFKYGTTKIK